MCDLICDFIRGLLLYLKLRWGKINAYDKIKIVFENQKR